MASSKYPSIRCYIADVDTTSGIVRDPFQVTSALISRASYIRIILVDLGRRPTVYDFFAIAECDTFASGCSTTC